MTDDKKDSGGETHRKPMISPEVKEIIENSRREIAAGHTGDVKELNERLLRGRNARKQQPKQNAP